MSSSRARPFSTSSGDSNFVTCWPRRLTLSRFERAVDLEVLAVEEPADVVDLPLDVLQRQVGLDRVAVEDHQGVVPAAPGGLADLARPAEAEVAP